ncbi:flagellar hook-basal body complex protein [Bradyrhizobium sp. LHD-71]|uniref:flagellar hook protein FlgE n=1 Tax=Bradyrhizobium sp. LHD-71 TaxID=3072141 RepID=UPI00280DCBB3|nr:flagellar hook-basal body complex protein [Bradyrhizobium sp. LHD-71]MDQ8732591.1 flagellar hook-basal body complex protein [Bradyrhizobium sp. LHD-71]
MGIFGALTTSVAGMRAQSFALENISGNIANSQTTAFKRIDTSFLDLIPDGGANRQLAGSVTAQSRSTNNVQGDVQASQVSTFMAINGDGFFSVQKPGGFSDNTPVFDGVDRYTRRGDFQLDKQGYLVNGAGYYLMGIPVDPTTGNVVGSTPQVLQFQSDFLPAQQTTKVDYRANLASYPLTTAHDKAVPGSELLRPSSFSTGHNPLAIGTPAPTHTDASITGSAQSNKLATPTAISATTLLAGAAATNSIVNNFVDADTITVNGLTINFHNGGGHTGSAAAGTLDLDLNTATVGDLMNAIGAITGWPASISTGGAITLHTGTAADLSISSTNTAALGSLGFTSPVSQARGGGGTPGTGQVVGNDLQAFLDESIAGGAVTAFDVAGSPVNLQFRWAKVDSASLGSGHADKWNLFYQVNANATGAQVAWQNVNTNFTFGANGQMDPPVVSLNLTAPSINGVTLGDVSINFGAGGLTQFADANGNVQVNQIEQDGFPAGQLQSVSVSDRGRIVGNYSNGRNLDLAEIQLASFNGPNFLKRVDGGAFEVTDESGPALSNASGRIVGSSLEGSNTDIGDEFTKLIVTQQAYSANTRVITTSNQMVQDLLNMLR